MALGLFSSSEYLPAPRFNYFAYGSNMSTAQLRDRVDRSDEKAIVVGRALLKDYQLVFNKKSTFQEINGERVCLLNGKANIGRASEINASVFGVLFSLTQSQIDWLDHAEGARMRPPHYQKKNCFRNLAE